MNQIIQVFLDSESFTERCFLSLPPSGGCVFMRGYMCMSPCVCHHDNFKISNVLMHNFKGIMHNIKYV